MISSDLKNFLAPLTRTMTLIWGAFLMATVSYVVFVWFLFGRNEPTVTNAETGAPVPIAPVLGVVAFLVVAASIFVERWWFSGARILKEFDRPAVFDRFASTQASAGVPKASPSQEVFERLPDGEKKLACLVPHYQTGMIIQWAMREAVAIFGVVAAILTADFPVVIPFAVGALAFVAIKKPRPEAFLEQVKRLPGAVA